MGTEVDAYLLLGGNEGSPLVALADAEALIGERIGAVRAHSRDHWTEPWGFEDPRLFLNRALCVTTTLAPEALLMEALAIEARLGRKRSEGPRYVSRPIDIDVLFFGDAVLDLPLLKVPHPRLQQRAFALAPLADIAPALVHPFLGRSVLHLLNDLLPR
ncbi:MAG: 2-amino-4-hydroxy-6-hydroxymethyldihydropteridine diphosphokinase [Flavobacteriales bacterium]|nr:2-amino-4-hydroxy-6-hydroxymethyldihydropteridine diphosphokinase [Flavobacteriales bacterium]